jgi:hypothetical protein
MKTYHFYAYNKMKHRSWAEAMNSRGRRGYWHRERDVPDIYADVSGLPGYGIFIKMLASHLQLEYLQSHQHWWDNQEWDIRDCLAAKLLDEDLNVVWETSEDDDTWESCRG